MESAGAGGSAGAPHHRSQATTSTRPGARTADRWSSRAAKVRRRVRRTLTHNAWYDLVRISATPPAGSDTGVALATVTRPSGSAIGGESRRETCVRPFGPQGRLYWIDEVAGTGGGRGGTALMSVKNDGSDKREDLSFPAADEIVPSPDGAYVAFQEGDNVYVAAMSPGGIGGEVATRRETARTIPGHASSRETADCSHAGAIQEYARIRQRAALLRASHGHRAHRHHDAQADRAARYANRQRRADERTHHHARPSQGDRERNDRREGQSHLLASDRAARRASIESSTSPARRSSLAGSTCTRITIASGAACDRSTTSSRRFILAYGVTTTLDPSMYSREHVPDGRVDRSRGHDRTARVQHGRQHHRRRRRARERDEQCRRRDGAGAEDGRLGRGDDQAVRAAASRSASVDGRSVARRSG